MGTQSPLQKRGGAPQIFGPCLLWPNGWMDQDGTWHGGRPQPRRLCVRWGPRLLPKKGAEPPPQFSANFYCAQTAGCITMPLGMEVGLSPGDFVFDRDPAIPPQIGQTAGWIKMALGMGVGLGPGHIVHDGDPDPLPQKKDRSPNFRPIFIVDERLDGSRWHLVWRWASAQATVLYGHPATPPPKRGQRPPISDPFLLSPNGWMNQDGTWHGGGPWSKAHCTRWGPRSPPPKKGQIPQFSAHFYCRRTVGWIKMALGMEVGLSPGDCVIYGDQATPRTEGTPTTTQFLAHVYCGQTAGWMKTPVGTEVDLSPGHNVLDGVPALRETGTAAPSIGPCLLWPRSPISATAELLLLLLSLLFWGRE